MARNLNAGPIEEVEGCGHGWRYRNVGGEWVMYSKRRNVPRSCPQRNVRTGGKTLQERTIPYNTVTSIVTSDTNILTPC